MYTRNLQLRLRVSELCAKAQAVLDAHENALLPTLPDCLLNVAVSKLVSSRNACLCQVHLASARVPI